VQTRTEFFLAYGTREFLFPIRSYWKTKERLGQPLGGNDKGNGGVRLECHEYEELGHATCGQEFLDFCGFLERVVPG
jgi:hypothetical protein